MRISRRKVGSGQWAVGSKKRALLCQLPTAHCLLILALLLLAHVAVSAQAKRIVILKVDGLQPDIVDRFVRERDARTGKSLLPWMAHVFYERGTRLANFYVRGTSLSAPSWSMLETGQHLQIKGNVEYDRFTLHSYDYLNFLPFYFNNALQSRVDMPGVETLDEIGLPLLIDAYAPAERFVSFQLYQRGMRWRTMERAAENRFLRNPRELLDEWTMGFDTRETVSDQLERELIERLSNPHFRYLDLYISSFDHTAHHNRDRESQLYVLQSLDATIGRIWTAIQKSPQAQDTALILVSDHGFNTDERVYSQGYNLVHLLGSREGGGHHVVTKRRLLMDYALKGADPFVPLITTTTADSFYLKGQSTDYPTALLDFDGNERASIHLRDSDLNILQILLQQLQRQELAPVMRRAMTDAFFQTLDRRREEWAQDLSQLNEEMAALRRANEKQRSLLEAQKKRDKEARKNVEDAPDTDHETHRQLALLDLSEQDVHSYSEYTRTLANLLALHRENFDPARIKIADVIAKGAMGTHNDIHTLQNYVVGFAPGGPMLTSSGALDMSRSFQRVDYFKLLHGVAVRNNVQPEVSSHPINFVAVRIPQEKIAPALERDLRPSDDVVWIYEGENQALVLSRVDEAGRLSFRYLPITNLSEDERGLIHFERVEWRAGLPLKIWEDAQLQVPEGSRSAWLNEWHTDLEWLRALHKTAYSNGLIGLHEQLARHPNEALNTDVPGLTDDERILRRFRSRQREMVEADMLVLANDHWNFDVRGFNPGGNHGSFFRISTHSTLMLAGGEQTGIPRGLVVEEPYDSLSFMPTVLALTGQLHDGRMPVPVLWERGFRRFPGRIITEVLNDTERDRRASPMVGGTINAP
jgi:hypothetical protein